MEPDMNLKTGSRIIVRSKTGAKKTGDCGFTLLETAIAFVVMMVMSLAAASLFVFAIKYDSGANDRALSLTIAQQRMERLRRADFTDASLNIGTSTASFTSAGHPYTIVTTIGGSALSKVITAAASSKWASTPATIISKRSTPALGLYFKK
jgi:Tfp pilus assembly protein PilV